MKILQMIQVIVFSFILCIMSTAQEGNILQYETITSFQKISELAEKMEVFPIDLIAKHRSGPIASQCRPALGWKNRYEITFDQYFLFHEFKDYAQYISKEDFLALVTFFDKALPKEKALILTVIYIYEWTHRNNLNEHSYPKQVSQISLLLPHREIDISISSHEWDQWIILLKQSSHDNTIVFPSIESNEETLKTEWEKEHFKALKVFRKLGNLPQNNSLPKNNTIILDKWGYFELLKLQREGKIEKIKTNLSATEKMQFDALYEYLCVQYQESFSSGCIYRDGNSSAKPKTLGDIATQLLMSRLPYEGNN